MNFGKEKNKNNYISMVIKYMKDREYLRNDLEGYKKALDESKDKIKHLESSILIKNKEIELLDDEVEKLNQMVERMNDEYNDIFERRSM